MSQAEISNAAAMPLADATCQTLLALVLRSSALAPDRQPPSDFIDALRQLAEGDAALAAVLPSADLPSAAADVQWELAAQQLPAILVRNFRNNSFNPPLDYGPPATAACGLLEPLLGVCHLVLRQRALESRFTAELDRQKTAAIYQFAYGLSHELNNPLANIATRAGLLAQDESHPQRSRMLEAIVNHAMRGCEMLGDLMLVARPPKLTRQPTQIDALMAKLIARAQSWAAPFQVTVIGQIDSQQSIDVDPAALSEAVWAIIRNAIEAMPSGGQITVRVDEHMPDGPRPGPYLQLEVSDQGLGLSGEALEHCFDPYYSGREAGRGLGLGLAKARRIVDLHGGRLSLSNIPGGGCLARIELPLGANK